MIRGKPVGSPIVESGSLTSDIGTIRDPFPDLCVLPISSPQGVRGGVGYPVPLMPAFPASQIPVRSRRGGGPAVCCGLAVCRRPALFQGWYCPNDSAVSVRDAATMRLKWSACFMTHLSGYRSPERQLFVGVEGRCAVMSD